MNKLKTKLLAYRKTLNFLGIERELELPDRTFKKWLDQNTEAKKVEQDKIKEYLKSLGNDID